MKKPPQALNPKLLVEASLFMSPSPLNLDDIMKIMGTTSRKRALEAITELTEERKGQGTVLQVQRTADGRYKMHVINPYHDRVAFLAVTTDFSKAILRTLAIVAFKQPIKQSVVVKMRGNKAYDHVAQLTDEGFVRKTREGRTYLLETTKKFEEYFGPPIKDVNVGITPASSQLTLLDAGETLSDLAAAVSKAEREVEAEEKTEAPPQEEPVQEEATDIKETE